VIFHTPPAFDVRVSRVPSEHCHDVWYRMLEWWIYQMLKKYENMFTRFDTIHKRDRQTVGRTDKRRTTA